MRFCLTLLLVLGANGLFAQVLHDTGRTNLISDGIAFFSPEVQANYSITNFEIDSALYEDKNYLPAGAEKIARLKKGVCRCVNDVYTLHSIADAHKEVFEEDSAKRYYELALQLTRDYLKDYPDSSTLAVNEAVIIYKGGEMEVAIGKLLQILERNPGDSIASLFLFPVYMSMGKMEEVLDLTEKMLRKKPGDLTLTFFYYLARGMEPFYAEAMKGEHVELALDSAYYSKLADVYERYPNTIFPDLLNHQMRLFSVFSVFLKDALSSEAEGVFDNLKVPVRDTASLYNARDYFLSLRDRKGIENQRTVHRSLGLINLMTRNYEEAIKDYRKAIHSVRKKKLNPDNYYVAEDYNTLISLYLITGDTLSALSTLKEKMKVQPMHRPELEDHLTLARYYTAAKNWKEAEAECRKALQMNKSSEWAYIGLAVQQIGQGNYPAAAKLLDSAYAINREEPVVYNLYGIVHLLRNDPSTAQMFFKRVQAAIPDNVYSKEALDTYFKE